MVNSTTPAAGEILGRYGSEDELYREFIDRVGSGTLAVQRCAACGYLRWPPTRACPQCWSADWSWEPVDGHGTIWSVAVYERAYGSHRSVPYNVVLIDLDAGPTMLSTVVGASDLDLVPGQRVVADLHGPGPGLARLVFRLDPQ
jgi:uncharacterized OB-fold protein